MSPSTSAPIHDRKDQRPRGDSGGQTENSGETGQVEAGREPTLSPPWGRSAEKTSINVPLFVVRRCPSVARLPSVVDETAIGGKGASRLRLAARERNAEER